MKHRYRSIHKNHAAWLSGVSPGFLTENRRDASQGLRQTYDDDTQLSGRPFDDIKQK